MSINVEVKKLAGSEVEINGEITAEVFESFRKEAVKNVASEVKIDGFRPGFAPENVLVSKIGETPILEEMAELALQKFYPQILEENKIEALGRPVISITKIAKNNPLGFKITTAVMPVFELPDYKEIVKKIAKVDESKIKVEDDEVEKTIESLRKMRAKNGLKPAEPGSAEPELPELNDEFAKSLGGFENVDALKKAIKENILLEKKNKEIQKRRAEIMEKIIKAVKTEVPKILIESEKERMMGEMKNNLAQSGLEWGKYLEHLKKTEEDLKKDWEEDAVKRVKSGMLLEKIATAEKITADEKELKDEMEKITAYYKNFNQDVDQERLRAYTENIMKNEKVFKFFDEV